MRGQPHFHLGGVPVRTEPLFFAVIAVIGLVVSPSLEFVATFVAVAFVSVLAHEMGHALAFRAFGHQPSVVLSAMGGLTYARARLSPWRSVAVSLAGPLPTLVVLGLPAWAALVLMGPDGPYGLEVILAQVVWINIVWSVLNLLPLLPLDGGNVVASLLEMVTGPSGRRIAAGLSLVLAVALGVWALLSGFVLMVAVAGFFGFYNGRELFVDGPRHKVAGLLGEAEQALASGQVSRAAELANRAASGRGGPAQTAWALELLGWCALSATDTNRVAALMADRRSRPSAYLQGAVALASGRSEEAVAVMAWAFANDDRTLCRLLGAAAASAGGVTARLADELVAIGEPKGRHGALALRAALERFGRVEDARLVSARLGMSG